MRAASKRPAARRQARARFRLVHAAPQLRSAATSGIAGGGIPPEKRHLLRHPPENRTVAIQEAPAPGRPCEFTALARRVTGGRRHGGGRVSRIHGEASDVVANQGGCLAAGTTHVDGARSSSGRTQKPGELAATTDLSRRARRRKPAPTQPPGNHPARGRNPSWSEGAGESFTAGEIGPGFAGET